MMKKLKLFLFVALFAVMSYGGFSAYKYYTMTEDEKFLLANIEALTNREGGSEKFNHKMDRVTGSVKVYASVHVDLCPNASTMTVASCGCNFTYEAQNISCCVYTFFDFYCDFAYQNPNC